MTILVKLSKTFHLSGRLDWYDIKNRVEGVKLVDDRRAVMVFRNKAPGATTTLLGANLFAGVKTCSLFEAAEGDINHGNAGHETGIVQELIKASGMKKNRILGSSCDFSVFQVDTDVPLDVHRCHQSLCGRDARPHINADFDQRRLACFLMDLEVDDALYITHDRVVWRISDTVPQRILVSVEGKGPSEARVLVDKSRKMMGLF